MSGSTLPLIPGASARSNMTLEARAVASARRTALSPVIAVVTAAIAFLLGMTVAFGRLEIGLMAAVALAGSAVFHHVRLSAWCSLLLITTVAARGVSLTLGLPSLADFLHYPVVIGLALAATDQHPRSASRAPARWLGGFLLVVLLSAIAHPNDGMRAALFILIGGEPLVVIWAIARWGVDRSVVRTIGIVAASLAVVQLPIAVYQGLNYGWSDPVQGTLTGHGAGHHVLGALFALLAFVVLAAVLDGRLGPMLGVLLGAICFAVMIGTGSMAVMIIASLAALGGAVLAPSQRGFPSRRFRGIVLSTVLGSIGIALVAALLPNLADRVTSLAFEREPPEIEIVRERADDDPFLLLFGSGPGTSASRASLLLVEPKPGTPLEALGLEPTELGEEIHGASLNPAYGGSVEADSSSMLGVVGDLGLVGAAGLVLLLVALWRRSGSSNSWLAPAARSAILLVAAISFLDNWMEYPEFSVPLAMLIGFVVSDVPEAAR
jgi:hypothetical protein